MKRRILSVILCTSIFIGCLTGISFPTRAANTEGHYTYTVSAGEATITRVDTSASGDVVLPDTLGGFPVTVIGHGAFESCSQMTSLTIPATVKTIDLAFYDCTNLTDVYYCGSLKQWCEFDLISYFPTGSLWLYADNLYVDGKKISGDLVIPEGVTSIGSGAFYGCKELTSVTIPEGVTKVGISAFGSCTSLMSVVIPASITTICEDAFCDAQNIYYNGSLAQWANINFELYGYGWRPFAANSKLYIDGQLVAGDVVIPHGVTHISKYTFCFFPDITSITIPASVVSIEAGAFSDLKNLTGIWVHEANENYSNDESGVLFNKGKTLLISVPKSLESYTFPGSVTAISEYAFYYCNKLTEIAIPEGIQYIPNYAFYYCTSLKSVTFPSGLDCISMAFGGCKNLSVIRFEGDAPTYIYEGDSDMYAFAGVTATAYYPAGNPTWTANKMQNYGGNLTWAPYSTDSEISIVSSGTCGENLTWELDTNGKLVISGTGKMTDFGSHWDGDYNYYEYNAPWTMYESFITEVVICEGVTSIGANAFKNLSNLTSVTLCNGLTTIGEEAFYDCSGLTGIAIPASVTAIGRSAFSGCDNLDSVHISDLGAWCQINFASVTSSPLFYAGILYLNGELLTEIQIPDGTSFIGNYAFYHSQNLTKVTIPDGVTSIGDDAFYYCKNLTTVTIPNSVTSIGKYAFDDCENLTDLTFGSGIQSIGSEAFSSCYNLTNLYICDLAAWCGIHFESSNANPLSYAEHLYLNGSKLQHLQIPEGITSIGDYAFYNCAEIISVIIPDYVADIGKNAFCGCKNLESVTIGKGVTVIGENAFRSCYKLQELVLGEYITKIGNDAFNNCSALTSLVIPDSVTGIGRNAFWGCTKLTDISIGAQVTAIGESAFCACYALTGIWVDADNPAYCNDEQGVLFDKDMTTLIQIPGAFAGSYTIPLSVDSIGIRAFYYCQKITEITIGSNVTSLGKEALSGCSNLEKIWVSPENITYSSDDQGVLYNKDKTELIYVPNLITGSYTVASGVTKIGEEAFSNRDYLTRITLPDSITDIGEDAFQACDRLNTIIFTGNAPKINSWAFFIISAAVYYPAGNDTWTADVMDDDYSARELAWYAYTPQQLEGEWLYQITDGEVTITGYNGFSQHIVIPAAIEDCPVTAIAPLALARRTDLVSVIIPESVVQIGRYAFYQCDNLVIVKFMGDCPAIDGEAFERITTVAYYPARRNTWSSEHFNHYGGSVTWRAYDENVPNTLASGKIDGFSWLLTDQGQLQLSGRGDMPDSQWSGYALSVKSVVFSNGITSIGKSAFSGCANLKEITIPESVKTIKANAFNSCDSLTDIIIPDAVTSIGSYAFAYCDNLTNVTIGRGVRTIENGAFRSCANLKGVYISDLAGWCEIYFGNSWEWDPGDEYANPLRYAKNLYWNNELVTELIIPSSVSTLHCFAFYNCSSLTRVVIPANVAMIEEFVFYGCENLTGIQVSAQNKSYTNDSSGVLYNKNKTLLVHAPGQLRGSYKIPAGVTDIAPFAFYQCKNLSSVILPDSVSKIDSGAFKGCSGLVSMTLPKNVTYISRWMFADCTGLTDVTVSDNVTGIGSYAFKGCAKLTGFVIPENVTYLSEQSFYGCTGLTSIRIPKGVAYIPEYAFYGCTGLTSIDISEGVNVIREYAFANCNSLTGLIIPPTVTTIEKYAFYACQNLRSIVISDSVAVLGNCAFGYNEKLSSITFRGYPSNISSSVFADVTAAVYYPAENENWTADTMLDYGGSLTWIPYEAGYEIIIASGTCGENLSWTLGDYGTLTISGTGPMYDRNIWYNHANSAYFCNIVRNVIIEEGATAIGDYVFSYSQLTHVTIPNSVTSIGKSAFSGCESLSGITIPDSVITIGSYAFSDCDSLTAVAIPDSVTFMGDSVFSSCKNLCEVTLPKEITAIGDNMFLLCEKLSVITIPDKVASIGQDAFRHCKSLNRIAIPGSVTSIASNAFYGCYSLTEIRIDGSNEMYCNDEHGVVLTRDLKQILLAPCTIKTYVVADSVESIGSNAFAYCKAMTSITIPVSVTDVGDFAFAYCDNLKTIYYYGSKEEWALVSKGENWDYDSFYLHLCMDNPSKGLDMTISADESHYIVTGIGTCTDEEVRIPMAENNIPVTEIAPNAFSNRRGIKKIVIPHTVTKIGESAFAGCSDLQAVSYQGTETQWQQVELGSNWVDDTVGKVEIVGAVPGDIDGNGEVNRDDVIALLLHVSMPDAFPISVPADYNGDGFITRDDVIQLLLHVSMPDAFPLS